MLTAVSSQSTGSIFGLIDNAPMNARRYFYWLLACGGTFLDGFSVVSLGVAASLLRRDFTMAPWLIGLIGSALVLGAVAGAALGGMAADRIGRKRALLLDMAVIAMGALICAVAPGPLAIVAGQFILGIGIGVDFPTSGSYVSEILPKNARSRMTVATIAFQSVGMIAAALAGMAVLRLHPVLTDWRVLLGSAGALALVIMLARTGAPREPALARQQGQDARGARSSFDA